MPLPWLPSGVVLPELSAVCHKDLELPLLWQNPLQGKMPLLGTGSLLPLSMTLSKPQDILALHSPSEAHLRSWTGLSLEMLAIWLEFLPAEKDYHPLLGWLMLLQAQVPLPMCSSHPGTNLWTESDRALHLCSHNEYIYIKMSGPNYFVIIDESSCY